MSISTLGIFIVSVELWVASLSLPAHRLTRSKSRCQNETSTSPCPLDTEVEIIYQHDGPSTTASRYSLDGPFLVVVSIGSVFIVLTATFLLASCIFLKKRNKVHVSDGDRGMVVEHRGVARRLEADMYEESVEEDSEGDAFDELSDESVIIDLELDDDGEHNTRAAGNAAIYGYARSVFTNRASQSSDGQVQPMQIRVFCPKHRKSSFQNRQTICNQLVAL